MKVLYQTNRQKKLNYSHVFVQPAGRFLCEHGGLMNKLSKDKGHACRCRDPRCSFQCRDNWAKKQAAILFKQISKLPITSRYWRGNLALPKNSTQQQHDDAKERFRRAIKKLNKKYRCDLEYLCVTHASDPQNKHYDLISYCCLPISNRLAQKIMRTAARYAGFRVSLKPLTDDKLIRGWCSYLFKANTVPKPGCGRFTYLLAKDGVRITWNSGKFWRQSKEQLWAECVKEWFGCSPLIKLSNNTLTNEENTENPSVSDEELTPVILAHLPDNPDDAALNRTTAAKIGWLTGVPRSRIQKILQSHPEVESIDNCLWRRCRWKSARPWVESIPPTGRIPFHCEYFPSSPPPSAEPAAAAAPAVDEMTADEFFARLDEPW